MKNIISISLSLLLLFSQTGLVIGSHYCQGEAIKHELMVGHKELDCEMSNMAMEHTKGSSTELSKQGCCVNIFEAVKIESEFDPVGAESNIRLEYLVTFLISYIHSFEIDVPDFEFTHYSPPLIEEDLHVLHEVFLI